MSGGDELSGNKKPVAFGPRAGGDARDQGVAGNPVLAGRDESPVGRIELVR